jgi:enamine deaminase RidA (YjgF/YER057c/UK114 family)
MSSEARLREAGIDVPSVPARLGKYVPGVRVGDTVYVSGQTGTREGRPVWVGQVGAEVSIDDARRSAALAAANALSALKGTIGDLDTVGAVVRLTVYVNAVPGFTEHPRIADAATDVLEIAFGEDGRGARSAVGVHSLPQGAPVEIDLIVLVRDRNDD